MFCDNSVVGIIKPLGCVRTFINDLPGMGSHSSGYLDIQFGFNRTLTCRAIEAVYQDVGDARIIEIVGLEVLSYVTRLVPIQLEECYGLTITQDPGILQRCSIVGRSKVFWSVAAWGRLPGVEPAVVWLIVQAIVQSTNGCNQGSERRRQAGSRRIRIKGAAAEPVIIDLRVERVLHLCNGACGIDELIVGSNSGDGEPLILQE